MNPSYPNPASGVGSGGQPQQPVFGANGMQGPISSGTGDVILAPEKKSRKGVVVAIVLAVIAVIGIFAVMFLIPRNDGGVSKDAKLAFNKYANYLLYGEDSDKALEGEYDENEIYYIDEIKTEDVDYTEEINGTIETVANGSSNDINNDNQVIEADEFFLRAENLWDEFYNSLNKNGGSLVDAFDEYRSELELYKMLTLSGDSIDDNWIQNRLDRMEINQAKKWINLRYSDFIASDYPAVKDYGEKAIEFYTLYIDNSVALNEAGCEKSENGKIICENDSYTETANTLVELLSKLVSEKNKVSVDVVSKCWALQDDLNGVNGNG